MVAQGAVSIGGLSAGNAVVTQVNHPAVGMISNGALVEREIRTDAERINRFTAPLSKQFNCG